MSWVQPLQERVRGAVSEGASKLITSKPARAAVVAVSGASLVTAVAAGASAPSTDHFAPAPVSTPTISPAPPAPPAPPTAPVLRPGVAFSNPVIAADAPDPDLSRNPDHSFELASTGRSPDGVFPKARSANLVQWSPDGVLVPNASLPGWAKPGGLAFAPEVTPLADGTRVIVGSLQGQNGVMCVEVWHQANAAAAPVPQPAPIACASSDVIDPSFLPNAAPGRSVLYFKMDGHTAGTPYRSVIEAVDTDPGLNQRLGPARVVAHDEGGADNGIAEAPEVFHAPNGQLELLKSNDWYNRNYHVTVGFAANPDVAFHTDPNVFLNGAGGMPAPGHPSRPIQADDGTWWIAVHSYTQSPGQGPRVVNLVQLVQAPDGSLRPARNGSLVGPQTGPAWQP